jgi:hypothetical protein
LPNQDEAKLFVKAQFANQQMSILEKKFNDALAMPIVLKTS